MIDASHFFKERKDPDDLNYKGLLLNIALNVLPKILNLQKSIHFSKTALIHKKKIKECMKLEHYVLLEWMTLLQQVMISQGSQISYELIRLCIQLCLEQTIQKYYILRSCFQQLQVLLSKRLMLIGNGLESGYVHYNPIQSAKLVVTSGFLSGMEHLKGSQS